MRYWQGMMGVALTVLAGIAPSWADSSQCYSIRDPDARRYCLAETRQNRSDCYAIQNPDERSHCLATVGGHKSDCYRIRDADERHRCLANF